jgi:hypothetical protein
MKNFSEIFITFGLRQVEKYIPVSEIPFMKRRRFLISDELDIVAISAFTVVFLLFLPYILNYFYFHWF